MQAPPHHASTELQGSQERYAARSPTVAPASSSINTAPHHHAQGVWYQPSRKCGQLARANSGGYDPGLGLHPPPSCPRGWLHA
eukprot:scaffold4994_cov19-Tisochrysis_lutea.AAC.4